MTVRNIKKNLAGAEDLLHGIGIESQSRGGAVYEMHKLDTYVPTYDVTEMQKSSLTFMRLYGDDTHYTDYRRNPAGTVGIPSDLGGVWEPIKTSELQVIGNSLYGAYVYGVDQVMCHAGTLYSWSGAFPKIVAAGSTPATSGGVGVGAWVDRTDITLRNGLSDVEGSKLISSPIGGTVYDFIASQRAIDPRLPPYNYKSTDSLSVRTASLQTAFNDANTLKLGIILNGAFIVSPISLVGHSDYTIYGTGTIAISGGSGAGFEIKNCTGIKTSGSVIIAGNAGLTCGVKVWASGGTHPNFSTCSLNDLEFSVVNCDLAWQFGDVSAPDNLLSETVIHNGYTYNCRQVFLAFGSQTVIEFNQYQLVAVDGTVGTSLPQLGFCSGAVVHINGGEAMMPGVSTGYGFVLTPINSTNYAKDYGSILLNGTAVEIASLWLLAYNPYSVSGISVGSGRFSMDNCTGFANFGGDNLQSDSSFTGQVIITDTCKFHRTSPKPTGCYVAGLTGAAKVKISDLAFDTNFNNGLQFYRPGAQQPKFNTMPIVSVNNLAGQSIPASTNTILKFTTKVSTGDFNFYYSTYNTSTGVFTVPAGGLKDISVLLEFNALAARPNSEIVLLIDGAAVGGLCSVAGKYVSQNFKVGDLSANQTLSVRFTNLDSTFSAGSTTADRMVISART